MNQENYDDIFLKVNLVASGQYKTEDEARYQAKTDTTENALINIISDNIGDAVYKDNQQKQLVLFLEINYSTKWIEFSRSDEYRIASGCNPWKKTTDDMSLTYDPDSNLPVVYLKYFEKSRDFKIKQPEASDQYLIKFTPRLIFQYQEQCRVLNQETCKLNIESIWLSKQAQEVFNSKFLQINQTSQLENYQINRSCQLSKLCCNNQALNLNIELRKIYPTNNSIDVNIKEISSNGIEIKNVFVYVCYQFNIKVTLKSLKVQTREATPIEIYNFKKVDQKNNIFSETVKLSFPNKEIPQILEMDNISCKHFIIIHVQFQKSLQSSIDILFPIVLLKGEQKEYVTKDYFRQEFSESLVEMVQTDDQQNPYKPQFSQLLGYSQ